MGQSEQASGERPPIPDEGGDRYIDEIQQRHTVRN